VWIGFDSIRTVLNIELLQFTTVANSFEQSHLLSGPGNYYSIPEGDECNRDLSPTNQSLD
jgi:hypothetical protein